MLTPSPPSASRSRSPRPPPPHKFRPEAAVSNAAAANREADDSMISFKPNEAVDVEDGAKNIPYGATIVRPVDGGQRYVNCWEVQGGKATVDASRIRRRVVAEEGGTRRLSKRSGGRAVVTTAGKRGKSGTEEPSKQIPMS